MVDEDNELIEELKVDIAAEKIAAIKKPFIPEGIWFIKNEEKTSFALTSLPS